MNDDLHLHDVLERATERIEPPRLAGRALREARRRRTRRRGVAAAAASAATVLALVVSVQVAAGERRADVPPADRPSASGLPDVAPPIPRDRIQPAWDPATAADLPETSVGLPQVLPGTASGTVTTAAVLLDDGREVLVVAPDGTRAVLDVPAGLGARRTLSLSPDGARVAALGVSGLFWRDLASGDWQRVDGVPRSVTGEGVAVTWLPGGRSVLLQSHLPGVQVDLVTGEQQEVRHLREYASFGVAPDGTVLTTGLEDGVAAAREWRGDDVVRRTYLGGLRNLQRPVVDEHSIAAARGSGTTASAGRPQDADGLVALDRRTLVTRAFLPVRDGVSYYVDGGTLSPRAWLDDDTVLFTVSPKAPGGGAGPKEYLLTWDVGTGRLARAACWDSAYQASVATDLLGVYR